MAKEGTGKQDLTFSSRHGLRAERLKSDWCSCLRIFLRTPTTFRQRDDPSNGHGPTVITSHNDEHKHMQQAGNQAQRTRRLLHDDRTPG